MLVGDDGPFFCAHFAKEWMIEAFAVGWQRGELFDRGVKQLSVDIKSERRTALFLLVHFGRDLYLFRHRQHVQDQRLNDSSAYKCTAVRYARLERQFAGLYKVRHHLFGGHFAPNRRFPAGQFTKAIDQLLPIGGVSDRFHILAFAYVIFASSPIRKRLIKWIQPTRRIKTRNRGHPINTFLSLGASKSIVRILAGETAAQRLA